MLKVLAVVAIVGLVWLVPAVAEISPSQPLDTQALVWEQIARRHDLRGYELFQLLGESAAGLPRWAWDAPVAVGSAEKALVIGKDQDIRTSEFSCETQRTQEIWLYAWSYIISDGYMIIYGSVTEATARIMYMSVSAHLTGPTGDSEHDWGLFTTQVHAWGVVDNPAPGVYFTQGIHYWNDFTKYPPSGLLYSHSHTIWIY